MYMDSKSRYLNICSKCFSHSPKFLLYLFVYSIDSSVLISLLAIIADFLTILHIPSYSYNICNYCPHRVSFIVCKCHCNSCLLSLYHHM